MANGVKSKSMKAVRGGSTKMAGKGHTGMQTPGQTASMPKGGSSKPWVSGGKTRMFGKQTASPAKAC
jgi:hypothetical protein